jgi:hypothetical protein
MTADGPAIIPLHAFFSTARQMRRFPTHSEQQRCHDSARSHTAVDRYKELRSGINITVTSNLAEANTGDTILN